MRRALAGTVVAILVLAACGGGGGKKKAAKASSGTTETSTTVAGGTTTTAAGAGAGTTVASKKATATTAGAKVNGVPSNNYQPPAGATPAKPTAILSGLGLDGSGIATSIMAALRADVDSRADR